VRICLVASSRVLAPARAGNPLYVQLYGLANALVSLGHEVDVVALPAQDRAKEVYNTYEIGGLRLPGSNPLSRTLNELCFGLATPLAIWRLARQSKPDVIHFDASVPAFFALLFARGQKMAPSVFWHGGPVPGPVGKAQIYPPEWHESRLTTGVAAALQSYIMNRVSRVIVLSEFLKETLVQCFKLEPSKLVVVPPGVDSNLFRPGADCSRLRQKYKLPENTPVVLCVAKIAAYKNQLTLVRAMPEVIKKHPKAKLLLVGAVNSSSYYSEIRGLVRSLSLEGSVIFTGPIVNAELPKYHTLADVFVLPSTAEGLAGVLIEAMSCGKAAVASDIPQNREVAKHGDEVIFVNPNNTQDIAGAINRLLDDSELRRILGQNARRTVLEYFGWKVVAAQIAEVYHEAILRG